MIPHSDIRVTMNIYVNLHDDGFDEMYAALTLPHVRLGTQKELLQILVLLQQPCCRQGQMIPFPVTGTVPSGVVRVRPATVSAGMSSSPVRAWRVTSTPSSSGARVMT